MTATPSVDREALRRTTAPRLLCERARSAPDSVAFRCKQLGLYRERSWREYAALVARTARAFATLGLARGDRVAIMGDACEDWLICDLAAQSLGAIVYGVYPTASASEVEYQLRDGGAVMFVAQNQEYVDKILSFADRLPELRWIIVLDHAAMFAYEHGKLLTYDALLAGAGPPDLDWLERQAAQLAPDAPAFIVYTSGTTGHPKGALVDPRQASRGDRQSRRSLSHARAQAAPHRRLPAALPRARPRCRGDAAADLTPGAAFRRKPGRLGDDPVRVRARRCCSPCRAICRSSPRRCCSAFSTRSGAKRATADLAMGFARGHVRRRWAGEASFARAALYRACRAGVFVPILNKLGFDRLELAICAGAPLPPETMTLWQMLGVNVVEMYGQTETAGGIISGQRGPFPRPGDVGTVPAGWEVKLADRRRGAGEESRSVRMLLEQRGRRPARSRARTAFCAPATSANGATARSRLIDRARDFIVTSGGKTISPSFIENILRTSPYVAEAIVFGHGRKYLTALIEIDADTVSDWARGHDVPYTGFTSLARPAPTCVRLIGAEIERANGELARAEQIKAFRILPKALDPEEDGEPVTPTRKVKRHLMYERFQALVEAMYDDREERLIAAAQSRSHDAETREDNDATTNSHGDPGHHGGRGLGEPGGRAGRLRHRRQRGADRSVGGHQRAADRRLAALCRPPQRRRRHQRQEDPADRARRPGRAVESGGQCQAAADPGQCGAAGALEPVVDVCARHRRDQARQCRRSC